MLYAVGRIADEPGYTCICSGKAVLTRHTLVCLKFSLEIRCRDDVYIDAKVTFWGGGRAEASMSDGNFLRGSSSMSSSVYRNVCSGS